MTQLAESYVGQPSYKQLDDLQDSRLQEFWNDMLLPHLSSLFNTGKQNVLLYGTSLITSTPGPQTP